MKHLPSALLAASLTISALPALATRTWGPDLEAGAHLTTRECLAMQAAKKDGASRADMKKACQWTTDENGSNNLSATEKPRAVDSTPYGLLSNSVTPRSR
jgi:hypothetical protein